MPKRYETRKLTLEEFVDRVKKYLKIIVQELKKQRSMIENLKKSVESLKAEVDTIKAKLSRIERRAVPAVTPVPTETAPEEAIGTELDMVLPEVPPIEEIEAPKVEASAEETKASEMAVPPVPQVPSAPKEQQVPPSGEEEKVEEFDLEKYLERLEHLEGLEKVEVPEIPSAEEIAVPEVTPDSEEGKPVSPKELKKKEKDILKALSELEFA